MHGCIEDVIGMITSKFAAFMSCLAGIEFTEDQVRHGIEKTINVYTVVALPQKIRAPTIWRTLGDGGEEAVGIVANHVQVPAEVWINKPEPERNVVVYS